LRERVKVYTYMSVKEDGISLFGFNKMEELELFNKLITVNGVGPKAAISLMGALIYGDIIMAVVSEDAAALSKAPGLGKKTAQKIILELKDKFKNEDFLQSIWGAVCSR
ncbi:Holliday junction branch migration protein RuvA, partial [Anaerotignum faecicola]|nr:Holliday junction branch migration protein RuvA [Anaerotignum faecicola]